MDLCVYPLQERMEEWKKTVVQLDKDHMREYKKAKNEIKKASTDTLRLQKKAKKGRNDVQDKLDSAMQDVNDKFLHLEEIEKAAVRTALIEERNRFCQFISCLRPVVEEEISMLTEVTHLQEVMDALCMQAGDPSILPPASEQFILDLESSGSRAWSLQKTRTPPSTPSSLGSRKSSMCSISSVNSSSSGSSKAHSPRHNLGQRPVSQPPVPFTMRLTSVSSQDSGFTSQDTLFQAQNQKAQYSSTGDGDKGEPPTSSASTWSNWPETPTNRGPQDVPGMTHSLDRPHTISSAYERYNRPALTAQTFQPPEDLKPDASSSSPYAVPSLLIDQIHKKQDDRKKSDYAKPSDTRSLASPYAAPCIIPKQSQDSRNIAPLSQKPPTPGPKPRIRPVAPPVVPEMKGPRSDATPTESDLPVYVNMNELANLAIEKKETEVHGIYQSLERKKTSVSQLSAEEVQRHQKLLRKKQEEPKSVGHQPDIFTTTQNQEGCELADAIKELEASTAALQMAYEGREKTQSSVRHSIAGYGPLTGSPVTSCPRPPESLIMAPKSEQEIKGARRSSVQNKPPTPVRRSSSITTSMSSMLHSHYAPSSISNERENIQREVTMAQHVSALPDQETWLPPPPEYVTTPTSPETDPLLNSLPRHRGSVAESHATIINTLNAVFSQQTPSGSTGSTGSHYAPPNSLPLKISANAYMTGDNSSPSPSQILDDITPTAENPPSDNFLCQIKRGVSLRKTQSNDRSAPRISSSLR